MSSSEVQVDSNRKKRTYRSRACGNCSGFDQGFEKLCVHVHFSSVYKCSAAIRVDASMKKCDGTRPSCLQCLRRPGRPHVARCHYPNAKPSESQNLEADIRSKEALLQELEEPILDDTTVKLSVPYAKAYDVEQFHQLFKPSAEHDISSDPLKEPLIDHFLNSATEFGFFLHIHRFRQAALLPEGHSDKPHIGLLNVVKLWGYHLRRAQDRKAHYASDDQAQNYLSLAITHQPGIISSSHPKKVIHAVQAEVLLGMYLYHASRPLTAKYHLNAALNMALAAGIHKIRNLDASSLFQYPTVTDTHEEGRRITEGEKINGFWVTLSLNICLEIALQSPLDELLMIQGQTLSAGVDMPWPMDIQSYATRILIPVAIDCPTVERLSIHYPGGMFTGEQDALAMYIRSSLLLGRAYILFESMSCDREAGPEKSVKSDNDWRASISSIDKLIDSFRSNLVPFDQSESSTNPVTIFATHIMTNSATIFLCNCPFTSSSPYTNQKRLWAAESCAQLVGQYNQKCKDRYLNPTLIPLLILICQAIIDEIVMRDRMGTESWEELPSQRRKELKREIHTIFDLLKANGKQVPSALAGKHLGHTECIRQLTMLIVQQLKSIQSMYQQFVSTS
ncbi:hypothetical protein F5050DRAFT_1812173 [Lentinula boryana]|uniref:Transcription factor domain-containing protein n=1 Tax=Lentinula boryana TaxID=40481 RepID=A0ABQ8Q218_9AGAR|nr:hypothetical protein F5050DRAFT_1812173 [Lentinula boryana]